MTHQTSISPDSSVLTLAELKIPGRTGPVSKDPLVWGINLAAAQDNFPRHGLQCLAGPWGNMGVGDKLVIFWGDGNQVLQETVDQSENGNELTMFIPAARIADGAYDVSYRVTRLGGTPAPSEVMKVFVKLTRPGGHDDTEEPGHPKLLMSIPEEILEGGIDKENVAAGVPITIGPSADGPQPYPDAAVGDVIQVTWGGVFVLSDPLTQDQADGKTPVIVHIDEATIRQADDSDDAGLAVAFEVYDVVDNRSEDWSAEQRVVVAIDATRLGAPLLKEALNNVLDVDKLGDANGTAQVLAVDGSKFKVGDTPFIRVKGTPVEGAPIDVEIPGEPLVSVPSIPEIKIPNAVLRQLAKTQIALSYRLKKADNSPDLRSRTQFISAIGEVQRLAAPVALDAVQGALDPELARVRVEIAFDSSFAAGQAIKLFWLGTRPELTPYLPELPLRPITDGDIVAGKPLLIIVDKVHLTPINGGKLELYYQLLIEDTVLGTLNRVNATHAIRESIHADILNVGEPRLELPEPKVAGVVDDVLPPDTDGTTLTVEYRNTVKDDVVTYEWVGSKTGKASDSVKLNSFTAGQPVPFTIEAELITGNEGGTVSASYFIKRAAGGISYSNALTFSVGSASELRFTNEPYQARSGARLKDIELSLTAAGQPLPDRTVTLTLPAGTRYADGGSGARDFPTNATGQVSVAGVKASMTLGDYTLIAASAAAHATAPLNIVQRPTPVSIPVGGRPRLIAVSRDGTRAYVANRADDTVSVIDTANQTVIKTIPIAGHASRVVVSPDGTRVYVGHGVFTHGPVVVISVIDTAGLVVIKEVEREGRDTIYEIALSPDGTRLYASHPVLPASVQYYVIDTASWAFRVVNHSGEAQSFAFSLDGARAYIPTLRDSSVNSVSIIDTANFAEIGNIAAGSRPTSVVTSPDGLRAYLHDYKDMTLSVINLATQQVIDTVSIAPLSEYGYLVISPDGTRLLYSEHGDSIRVFDTTNGLTEAEAISTVAPAQIAFHPNGTKAYVCNAESNAVSVIVF